MGLTAQKALKVVHIDDLLQTGWKYKSGNRIEERHNNYGNGLKTKFGTNGHHPTWFTHSKYPLISLCWHRHQCTIWEDGGAEGLSTIDEFNSYLGNLYPKIPKIKR